MHPHPRVTVAAKTRNRRAACPLPQLSGRGIFRKIRLPYAGSKRARDLIIGAVRDPSTSFALLTSLSCPWVSDSSRTMKMESFWCFRHACD